jgi:hypothetical protein
MILFKLEWRRNWSDTRDWDHIWKAGGIAVYRG